MAHPIMEKTEASESSFGDFRTPLWKKMWQLKFPPKVKIFAWRACMNGLLTMLNLGRRGVNIDGLCPLCGKEMQSTIYALLLCGKVKEVWWNWQTCPVNIMAENHDLVKVALHILQAGTPKDLEVFFITASSIWYNRNQAVHEGQCLPSSQI